MSLEQNCEGKLSAKRDLGDHFENQILDEEEDQGEEEAEHHVVGQLGEELEEAQVFQQANPLQIVEDFYLVLNYYSEGLVCALNFLHQLLRILALFLQRFNESSQKEVHHSSRDHHQEIQN